MTKKTIASEAKTAMSEYLKSREVADFNYLCDQTIYLLGIESFLVNLEKKDGYPLAAQFTISKKDVESSVFVEFSNSNIISKTPSGIMLGKFKFNPLVASKVAGILFGEWVREVAESISQSERS